MKPWLANSGVVIGLCAALLPSPASAAPITFNTALPVAQGQWLIREQYLRRHRDDDTAVPNRDVHVDALGNVLAYGVSGKLALFAVAPWFLDKTLEATTPAGRVRLGDAGIGDTQIFARYTVFQDDGPGRSFRVAPIAGFIAPTGSSDQSGRFGRLPRAFQNGGGAWGGLGGVIATYQTLAWEVDADAAYQATGIHDGYRAGAVTQADVSFQYRLWPRQFNGGVPAFFYGVLETNLIHAARDRMNGGDVADTGGSQWFVSPGLQYVTLRYVLETAVQLPLVQDMNGRALRDDYIFHVGFRIHFQ
ncbi:MAG: transporter [Gammaproteobacteria bacterium]|nr:transporter [Gammaproteobacteria bacterium]